MKPRRISYPLLIASWLLGNAAQADSTYLLPQRVYVGDIAELVIEYDSKIPSLYAIDTDALRSDFDVLGIQSRAMRIDVEGEFVHRMQSRISLAPRHSGSLPIPALTYGERRSAALVLETLPLPSATRQAPEVFVEIEADADRVYVGQQLRVIQRLWHRVALQTIVFDDADADDALGFSVREARRFGRERNGHDYRVVESFRILVPQQAGRLEINPASLQGSVFNSGDSAIDARRRNLLRRSNPLELDVLAPLTSNGDGAWLPAKSLRLERRFYQQGASLEPGASLDFELSIIAEGIVADALPADLYDIETGALKIYPDQERRSTSVDASGLKTRLDQDHAVIADRGGSFKLPAVELAWWDVTAGRARRARLEALEIDVTVSNGDLEHDSSRVSPGRFGLRTDSASIAWLALPPALLVLLLLHYRFRLWRRLRQRADSWMRRRAAWRALRAACLGGDAGGARAGLLRWARLRWPAQPPTALHQIASRLAAPALLAEFERLDASLYAGVASSWDGRALWRSIVASRRQGRAAGAAKSTGLPALYPG